MIAFLKRAISFPIFFCSPTYFSGLCSSIFCFCPTGTEEAGNIIHRPPPPPLSHPPSHPPCPNSAVAPFKLSTNARRIRWVSESQTLHHHRCILTFLFSAPSTPSISSSTYTHSTRLLLFGATLLHHLPSLETFSLCLSFTSFTQWII